MYSQNKQRDGDIEVGFRTSTAGRCIGFGLSIDVNVWTRNVGMEGGWVYVQIHGSDKGVNVPPQGGEIPLPSGWEVLQSKLIASALN